MRILTCYNNIMHPGIAKLVSRLVWEHEARGSSPRTPAKITLKNRLFRRFFCVISSIFEACLTTSQLWSER